MFEAAEPSRRVRWLFWLLLSAASVFFAEASGGSYPFPFVTAWGIFVLIPLYGLHILILGSICFSKGEPRYSTLFPAGAIVGLYEAYITKMLWAHTWGGKQNLILGVSLNSFPLLVLFWHPLMAFVVPLLWTRAVCVGLPESRAKRFGVKWFLIFGLAIGLMHSAVSKSLTSALGCLLSGLMLAGLAMLWRRVAGKHRFTIQQLLPNGPELVAMGAVLLGYFVLFGLGIRRDKIPGIGGQATIWACYLVFGLLLWLNLEKPASFPEAPAEGEPAKPEPQPLVSIKGLVAFTLANSGMCALVVSIAPWSATAVFALTLMATAVIGLQGLWVTIKGAAQTR